MSQAEKMELYYHMLVKWVHVLQMGGSVKRYFEENHYKKVAIYGMAEMGGLLYDELTENGIDVAYVIDKARDAIYAPKVVSADDKLDEVDVIVVTANYYYDEITGELSKKTSSRVVSLYEVINDSEIYYSLDNNIKEEYL